jgi:hypothetical protein
MDGHSKKIQSGKAWKFWKILSLVPDALVPHAWGWAWDHGFEMCGLVLHAWVGRGTMGLKCVNLPAIVLGGSMLPALEAYS